MIVEVTNLSPWERSVPTPANISFPIEAGETIVFEYPKAFDQFFQGLEDGAYNFGVELTTTPSEVEPTHPELDFESLDEAINEANQLKLDTKTSIDGSDVLITSKWVSDEVYLAFQKAIAAALNAKQFANDQSDVSGAVTALQEAIQTFKGEQKDGLKLDTTELIAAVAEAKSAKTDIITATDAFEVDLGVKWVEESALTTLDEAIQAAEKTLSDATEQQELVTATETLNTAVETFNDAIQTGKKLIPDVQAIGKLPDKYLSVEFGEKKMSELVGKNFNVNLSGETMTIYGDLLTNKDYAAFPDENKLTDWYVPIYIDTDKDAVIKGTTLQGKEKITNVTDLAGEVILIFAIKKDEPVRTFTLYGTAEQAEANKNGIEYTVDASNAFFLEPVSEPLTSEELEQSVGSKKLNELVGEDYSVVIDEREHTITATGTIERIDDYSDMFPDESKITSYYLPVKLMGEDGTKVETRTLLGADRSFEFGKTNDPEGTMVIVFAIDPENPKRTVKITPVAKSRAAVEQQPVTYTVDASECTFDRIEEDEEPVVTTSVPEGSKTYYGKRADELQSRVTVKDTEITGTLKYAEGVQIMLHEPKYQEGNFLALDFSVKPESATIEVELQGGEPINPGLNEVDDGYCVFRITDKDTQKIHVVGTNGSKKFDRVYSLTNLTVEPKPVKVTAVKIAGQQQAFKGVTYSDLMSPDVKAQLDGKNINVTGTLYKFTGDQLGTNAKDKNCAVVNITVDREGVVVTRTDNPAFSFTYTGKTADDFIIPLTSEKNTCELVFYPDAAHKESQSCGTAYTVNASGATMETRTKAEIAAPLLTKVEIPGQTESWKGVEYSKLMSPDTSATLKGNKIEVTGTLYKYENWGAFGEDLQNKNYLVLTMVGAKEGVEVTFQKINGKDGNYTYPGDDLDFDLVLALDDQHKTVDFTFYENAEDKSQKQNGQVYTLDCTKVTFETKTQEQAAAVISMDQVKILNADQLKSMAKELKISTTAKKAETLINKIEAAAPSDAELSAAYHKVVGE